MQAARTISADLSIPPIAVSCNPSVDYARHPMDPGDKQKAGQQIPAGKLKTDRSPGVGPSVNAALLIDSLHGAHGFFQVDIRESPNGVHIVKIEELDASSAVERANPHNTGAAERTGSIEEHSELW